MLTVLEKVNFLRKAPIFQGVRTESLARVAAIAEEVSYEARHLLFSENDAAESMYVLLEGEVVLMRNGREAEKVRANNVIGAIDVLAGGSHAESAVANQTLRALRIDQQDFYDAMAEDFNITRGILRALVRLVAGGS